jgi:hypothetical protein
MSALVPKGLAAAVLASLPVQAGLPYADLIQETIYAAIFFSILLCAALVFALERGMLDAVTAAWLRKFAAQPAVTEPRRRRDSGLLFQPALGLVEIEPALQEPNPVDLRQPPPITPDDARGAETSDDEARGPPSVDTQNEST